MTFDPHLPTGDSPPTATPLPNPGYFGGSGDGPLAVPCNVDAERGVLGSLLLDASILPDLQLVVKTDDFFLPEHQTLYSVFLGLLETGRPLELPIIEDELDRIGRLQEVGGMAAVIALENSVAAVSAAPALAKEVAAKSKLRKLLRAARLIQREAANETDERGEPLSPAQVLERAEQAIYEIGQETTSGDFVAVGDLAFEQMDHITKLASKERAVIGLRTFFADLDMYTTGFLPSQLIILAARPSVGKTAFALNIALQAAKGGRVSSQQRLGEPASVAFFSLEMGKEELVHRLLGSLSRVSGRRLRQGRLNHEELAKLNDAAAILGDCQIHIDDTAALTPTALRAKARRLKARDPRLGLIIVDYLQLMRGSDAGGRFRQENRQQEVSEISRSLKALAKELQVPVLALSQLSRQIEQRGGRGKMAKPVLSDLRESGSIEQDADIVMFVHREKKQAEKGQDGEVRNASEPELTEIIIGKQRNGPIGTVQLMFFPEYQTFHDAMRQPGPGGG